MHARFLTIVALAAITLVTPLTSEAQNTNNPYGNREDSSEVGIYTPPSIFADTLVVAPGDHRVGINGTFTALNDGKETIGDLVYRIQLLGALPAPTGEDQIIEDTAPLYDSYTSTDIFALAPGTQKSIAFSYTPPGVPAGEYRIRAQIITSHGRELGWADTTVTLTGEGLPYILLTPGAIQIAEYGEQVLPPLSGPNVTAGTSFAILGTAENTAGTAVTAVPVLQVYAFAASREKVTTERLAPITWQAKESKKLDIPVTAAQKPEVYYATLHFESPSGARQSSLAEYRWVVRGLSGEIVHAKLVKHGYTQGQTMQIAVDTVGPADAETTGKGSITSQLKDEQGTLATISSEPFELTDALQSHDITFTLDRNVVGAPSLLLTLTDDQNNVLDTYDVAFPLAAEELQALAAADNAATALGGRTTTMRLGLMILGLAVLVLVVLLFVWWLRRKQTPPGTPPPVTPVALLIAGMLITGATFFNQLPQAEANGIVIQESVRHGSAGFRHVEIFVNQPRHEATYATGETIPLAYNVTWLSCINGATTATSRVRYLTNGGKTTAYQGTWGMIPPQTQFSYRCPGGPHFCLTSRGFVAPQGVQLASLNPVATDTTLQFQSAFQARPFDLNQFNSIVHIWLNLQPPGPQCSDKRDNDGDGRIDCADPGCWTDRANPATCDPTDDDETDLPCSDAKDNDGDSRIDAADPACHADHDLTKPYVPTLLTEVDTQCSDTKDNDGDSRIDTADPACHTDRNPSNAASYVPALNSEVDPQCSDAKDNDNDARNDSADPGCHTDGQVANTASYVPTDNDEADTQCSDLKDNDADNKNDSADPGCHTDATPTNAASYVPLDNDETDPQCSDTRDNDNDGKTDAADPACHTDRNVDNPTTYNPGLNTEVDTVCSDGKDNDGDTKIDRDDPGCRTKPSDPTTYTPSDTDEADPNLSPGPIIETE